VKPSLLLVLTLGLVACAPDYPDSPAAAPSADVPPDLADSDPAAQAIKASMAERMPDVTIDAVRPSPIAGIYEIQAGLDIAYASADGRYLFTGELSDLVERRKLSEERRKSARVAAIDSMDPASFIVFAPDREPDYTITVFTDIDCGYCRMLHKQVAQYNEEGIAIRYAFFPRTGENTPSFFKAEQVWCSADHRKALTEAKLGKALDVPKDCDNPVGDQLQMASRLRLEGTPSIILPDGSLVFGYQPPEELLHTLEATAATRTDASKQNG